MLKDDKFKQIIIDSLEHLVKNDKLIVYGFVIMPNHIHIIWENKAMNGQEMPYTSFMKFTGHAFLDELRETNDPLLERFKVDRYSRKHQFWQRHGLPIIMYNHKMLEQKLDYIHYNPLQRHWNLVDDPNDYLFSSCSFYERNDFRYPWLTHYMVPFGGIVAMVVCGDTDDGKWCNHTKSMKSLQIKTPVFKTGASISV